LPFNAKNKRVTLELSNNRDLDHLMLTDIEQISFISFPEFYKTFEVEIGGVFVFKLNRADFDTHLNQIKICLSKIKMHTVRFHFSVDLSKLGSLQYENVPETKKRHIPNPAYIPEINDITGECLNTDEASIEVDLPTGNVIKRLKTPEFLSAPSFVLHIVPGDQRKDYLFVYDVYEHKMVTDFEPINITPSFISHLEIKCIEPNLTLEEALARDKPFKAEYRNILRYSQGMASLIYAL
jgi:hypothetical protein